GALALIDHRPVRADQVTAQVEVLLDSEDVEDAASLRHMADAHGHDAVCAETDKALAVAGDRPAARSQQPRDRAQRRGLAGAVATEDGHDLPRVRLQRDALEGLDVAVEDVQVTNLEDCQSPKPPASVP